METLDFVFFKSVKGQKGLKGEPFSIELDDFCDHIKKHYPHIERAEKDGGCIVFAQLENNRRGNKYTLSKTAAVIDYDHQEAGEFARIAERVKNMGVLAWIYTTHSHTKDSECFRVVLPFAHPIDPEQGKRANKALADMVGGVYDTTTTQQARPFYTPAHPKGAPFENLTFAGYPIDPSDYATPAEHTEGKRAEAKMPEDPTTKTGVVGAFCRAYTVPEAIEEFLPDKYTQGSSPVRYTWAGGSKKNGLLVEDGGKYGYSFHGTDPLNASGKSHVYNAYDLVMVHKFNGVEADMDKFARSLPIVAEELNRAAAEDFAEICGEIGEDASEWLAKLDRDKKGEIKPTTANIDIIYRHDPDLIGWHYDTFTKRIKNSDGEQLSDNAEASIIVNIFGIRYRLDGCRQKIRDVLDSVIYDRTKDSLKEYFDSLPEWDGVPRVESLLIKFFCCTDNEYYRHIIKMHLTAAVARACNPTEKVKYDHVLTLAGAQGVGKSRFIRLLCPYDDWLNDSISTIQGKEGCEALSGKFLVELSELSALKKSEVEAVKSYLTREFDTYRPAYGRHVVDHLRRCVFFATTNETDFLRGLDGNRRFLIVEVNSTACPDFADLIRDKAQIWAEAKKYYTNGFSLTLPAHLNKTAEAYQKKFNQDENRLEEMAEKVREYMTQRIPADWETWDEQRRRAFYTNRDPLSDESLERSYIRRNEILWEMFGARFGDHRFNTASRDLTRVMGKHFPGWVDSNKIIINGKQCRGWIKK